MPLPNPPYAVIRQALQNGKVIPFLGAGASLGPRNPPGAQWAPPPPALHLPTGGELTDHLAHQVAFPANEPRDLAKVAQYYHVQAGRPMLNQELRSVFSHAFTPLPIHHLLASVKAPLLIVTTNYDTLIEQAFAAVGKPYDLVVHTTNVKLCGRVLHRSHGSAQAKPVLPHKLMIDLQQRTVIYKIHGSCNPQDPQEDQYVVTEDDYINFLSRMVRNQAIPAFCAEPFRDWPFLFLGYRLNDWNMRVVLNRIAQGNVSWAIERSPSPVEERFWNNRGVNVYAKSIDEFVNEIGPVP